MSSFITADICPHGTSSTVCEWCVYKATAQNAQKLLKIAQHKLAIWEAAISRTECNDWCYEEEPCALCEAKQEIALLENVK